MFWDAKLRKMRKTFYKYSIRIEKSKKQIRHLPEGTLYKVVILNPCGMIDMICEQIQIKLLYKAFEDSMKDNLLDKNKFKKRLKQFAPSKITVYEQVMHNA